MLCKHTRKFTMNLVVPLPHKNYSLFEQWLNFRVSGVTTETPKSSSFSSPREEKGFFDRAFFSQEVEIFIHDELQPDKGFDRLYDKAIDSLYKKLRRVLPNTFYGIHDFIEVSDETLPHPPT